MKLHPVTLKFIDESAALEKPFLSDYFQSALPQSRIFLIIGALLYGAFGILDALLMPEQKFAIWLIRFIIIGPCLVGVLLISFLIGLKNICSRLWPLPIFWPVQVLLL